MFTKAKSPNLFVMATSGSFKPSMYKATRAPLMGLRVLKSASRPVRVANLVEEGLYAQIPSPD